MSAWLRRDRSDGRGRGRSGGERGGFLFEPVEPRREVGFLRRGAAATFFSSRSSRAARSARSPRGRDGSGRRCDFLFERIEPRREIGELRGKVRISPLAERVQTRMRLALQPVEPIGRPLCDRRAGVAGRGPVRRWCGRRDFAARRSARIGASARGRGGLRRRLQAVERRGDSCGGPASQDGERAVSLRAVNGGAGDPEEREARCEAEEFPTLAVFVSPLAAARDRRA